MEKHNDPAAKAENQPEFAIQRVYIKDLSFEAPQSPAIFQQEWKPDLNLQIQTHNTKLSDDIHEVVLKLTVTAKSADRTAFLIEIQQAGIFTIKSFTSDQLSAVLGTTCPNILFPYARQEISNLATSGTFPPLYLAPINFDALYMQHLEQQKKGAANEDKEKSH